MTEPGTSISKRRGWVAAVVAVLLLGGVLLLVLELGGDPADDLGDAPNNDALPVEAEDDADR